MYKITQYTYDKAKKLGVQVVPSKSKNKKIDVIKNGTKLYSIGDTRYSDYPHYLLLGDVALANKRRDLYHKRHGNPPKGSRSWYAKNLLW